MYKADYDLLLAVFLFSKDFRKEFKYTVGEGLKKETLEMITLIYWANSKKEKMETFQLMREKIEVIRLFVLLIREPKLICIPKFD